MRDVAAPPGQPRRAALLAIAAIFTANGFAVGTWGARVPAIQDRLDVGPGWLALPLAALSAGALVAMPLAGRAASRLGSRRVVRAGLIGLGLALPLPALLPGLVPVACGTLLLGIANGALDVSMNAQGVAVERTLRRRVLSSLHAGFSFGGLLGAGAGALAAAAQVGPLAHFAAASALILAVGVPAARRLVGDRWEPAAAPAPTPAAAPAAGGPPAAVAGGRGRRGPLRALGFCCLLAEGAAMDWSAVHLRSIGAAPALAAAGYAGFSLAMACGRLTGDRLSERWGAVGLARRGGLAGGAALAAGLALGAPAAALAGYVALGAGLSVVIPLVFRAAATGADAGPALAGVTTTSYLGFLAGPSLIGVLASATSLPAALGVVAAAALAVGAGAGALEPRRPAGPAATHDGFSEAAA